MAGLTVLKVKASAQTTSFRYPRVQVGRLPTFDMPPPATIYGHIAGVLGEWFEPQDLEFAYTFTHSGKAVDLETIHPIERPEKKSSNSESAKQTRRGKRPTFEYQGGQYPVNVRGTLNIQRREFLLKPTWTLYLKSADAAFLEQLRQAFLEPYYAYILGRSQDLATCHCAKLIELERSSETFFSNTLIPFEWRPHVSPGTTVALPSLIDYERRRLAQQDRYLQLTRQPLRIFSEADDVISREALPPDFFVDLSETRTFSGHTLSQGIHFWPVRGPRAS